MDGNFNGRGVYIGAGGDRYEGEFRDGKKYGSGIFKFANGNECEGNWRENKLVETGEGLVNGKIKLCYMKGKRILFAN